MTFLDPEIVDLITYTDENGKKRVRPPYRNRKIYSLIAAPDSSGDFTVTLPENLNKKAVILSFPNGNIYNYVVNYETNQVKVIKIKRGTFFEIHVFEPTPIERSPEDPIWDDLSDDAKRALVIAWSDLICVDEFKSQVNVEWDFDKQDTLYQKVVAFRNNKGNNKSTDF